jgi:hypothetical protein
MKAVCRILANQLEKDIYTHPYIILLVYWLWWFQSIFWSNQHFDQTRLRTTEKLGLEFSVFLKITGAFLTYEFPLYFSQIYCTEGL